MRKQASAVSRHVLLKQKFAQVSIRTPEKLGSDSANCRQLLVGVKLLDINHMPLTTSWEVHTC